MRNISALRKPAAIGTDLVLASVQYKLLCPLATACHLWQHGVPRRTVAYTAKSRTYNKALAQGPSCCVLVAKTEARM